MHNHANMYLGKVLTFITAIILELSLFFPVISLASGGQLMKDPNVVYLLYQVLVVHVVPLTTESPDCHTLWKLTASEYVVPAMLAIRVHAFDQSITHLLSPQV